MQFNNQASKDLTPKQLIYKSFLDKKVFKVYDMDEKPTNTNDKYDINLENISALCHTNNLIIDLLKNNIKTSIPDFTETQYMYLSLSPIWNYLLGKISSDSEFNNHTSVTWSSSTQRTRHTSTKFGTKCVLFIDRFTKDNIEKLKTVFKHAIKNGLKYDKLFVLFDDEDGYIELVKYFKTGLTIIPIFKMSILLNFYEMTKLLNEYQIESIKYQQETTYNNVIKELKMEHRILNKKFNYQSKACKFLLNNKKLLKLLGINNINLNLDSLSLTEFIKKNTTLTNNEKQQSNNNNNSSSKNIKNTTEYRKLEDAFNLFENLDVSFQHNKLIIDLKNITKHENIITTMQFIKKFSKHYNSNKTNNLVLNIIISHIYLRDLTAPELYELVKQKTEIGCNIILDSNYDLLNMENLDTNSIDNNIMNVYNLDKVSRLTINKKEINYNKINDVIDFIIIDFNADTSSRFNNYLELLTKCRSQLGIIINIKSNNENNYLSHKNTWHTFNTFITQEEQKHNVNIVGLINDVRFSNFGGLEINKSLSLINNISIRDNNPEVIIKNIETCKKYKGFHKLILPYEELHFLMSANITYDIFKTGFIVDTSFNNIKFKKIENKIQTSKDDDKDDNNKTGSKNKELLEDEDDYSKLQIFHNLYIHQIGTQNHKQLKNELTATQIKCMNSKFIKENNKFIEWYDNNNGKQSRLEYLHNTVNNINNTIFQYLEKWF